MSLESSYEPTGQEQPRLVTVPEIDHGSVVQRDSGEEQLPANVTPALAPPDSDELVALLLSWIRTPDWSTSQTYLQAHPELLTEAATQALTEALTILTQHQSDQQIHQLLMLHQQLLQRAGQQGVEAAYQALLYQEDKDDSAATEQEEFQEQVIAWLQTPDWETSQTYLQSHPQLLTEAAEQMMEALKRSQEEQQAQVMINLHQALLRKARVEGIEVAYERFLVPEPKTPLSDQEVVVYQVLQDPDILNEAGIAALRRYWVSGQVADLNQALEHWHEALNLTPPDSPNWPMYLNNLGGGLRDRYNRAGDLADLEAAITAYQQAVQATPPDSPNWPMYLNNLGTGLRDRYEHTGDLADLEAAITAYQQAVQTTPPDSPNRPPRLNNLGGGLRDRYNRAGDLADLEAAITASQQAIQATPPDSPNWPTYLSNLGTGLHHRYEHTGDLADLEAAITAYQQAVQATPPDSPDRPTWLTSLGAGLRDRYEHTGDLADLEAAITASQQAIQATPPDSPDRPIWLNSLGTGLHHRYEHTGDLADLEATITAYQQAVQTTLSNSPYLSEYLTSLGTGLYDRYSRTEDLADLEAAITAWEKGWSIQHPLFSALPVTYQLGQQRQGAGIAASLVTAYLEQAKQRYPRSHRVPRRALEIAEGSKSRLLTQLVGRGPLPRPLGLSGEIAAREQQLLADLTALDTRELFSYDHFASTQEEIGHLQRLQWRQAVLRELEDLWDCITRVGPEGTAYVALRRGAALTWQELARQTKVSEPATALLSFFTTTDRALLFLLRAGWRAPRVVEVPLNRTGWADLLERFFREVHRYSPGLRRSETWDQPLHPLFTKAQHSLEGVERLILAPAGNGHLLPWGVLAERAGWHTSTGQPLPLVTLSRPVDN